MSRGFLLDTNIPSELTKLSPEARVVGWVRAQDSESLYLSVVTVGELRKGIALLAAGKRRLRLEEWLERELLPLFEDRILPISQSIGDRWGALSAACRLRGTPLNTADGLIAATALEHDLIMVTRNASDFVGLGVEVLNPWES